MDSSLKPHAVFVPYPAQGHINPLLQLAKLLHFKGFHITFVNTEYNHRRLLKSRGPNAVNGLSSFRFKTIPDGLPESDGDATQDIPSLCDSTSKYCLAPFKKLLAELNDTRSSNVPAVSCIVADAIMSFTLDAARELGIPEVLFWTPSAVGVLAYMHFSRLVQEGYTPLKDVSYVTKGHLDTVINWIPGFKEIRLRDLPSFIRTTDPEDIMLNFYLRETERAKMASAIVISTFDALDQDVLTALNTMLPPVYSIGPLDLLLDHVSDPELDSITLSLWKEDSSCLKWLDSKSPGSVVYVNFGSIAVMTRGQLIEFAWGLANSNKTFLWVIRPDVVAGETAVLPQEFFTETKNRSLLASWCPQEEVLKHPSIGGFLTHSGWNSTLESIIGGVPMICWPFFSEQQTNCRFCCREWEIGMEIDNNVKRDEVEKLVNELMEGEKGKKMRSKAMEWKKLAEEATSPTGSSFRNLDILVKQLSPTS